MDLYILDNHNRPLLITDYEKWSSWISDSKNRCVANTTIGLFFNKIRISTIFLGMNINFNPSIPPMLFETVIFGGDHDQKSCRYPSYEEAMHGHSVAVSHIRGVRLATAWR